MTGRRAHAVHRVAVKLRFMYAHVILGAATLVLVMVAPPDASAATLSVPLGTAANFGVLGGSTVTNTGPTIINGDLGLSPGSSVTGFPPGQLNGTQDVADAVAAEAKADLATAYDDAASRTTTATVPVELGGTTKDAGVYDSAAGTFGITGTLTLDAQGDPDAVFIFKAASTLITASASDVVLVNGAQSSHVYWQVGSSATLGTGSRLRGTVLALTSITVTTGTTVDGRVLARNGAVTLDTDTITAPAPGGLSISVPGAADLGSATAGDRASGHLGPVTVTDQRALSSASWVVTVTVTPFTTGGGSAAETISRSHVSYWSGPATATSGTGTFTPGQATATNIQTLNVDRTAFSLEAGAGNNSATWNPTVVIALPAAAVAGTYAGTVTHSVL